MEHTLENLLQQLGLEDEAGLRELGGEQLPLPPSVSLADATFWNSSQSAFLIEAIQTDGPWSPAVGQLDALIR